MIHLRPADYWRVLGLTLLLAAGAPARASEVDELRAQLEAMKSDYQARIQALEARLAQLEAQAAAPPPALAAEAPPPAPPPAPSGGGGTSSGTAFNPAIAVILGGHYAQTSADPANYAIAGFTPAGDAVGPGP